MAMPLQVDGVRYLSAGELAKELDVSRQTLWRWRREGKIPAGHRYRDQQVVFSEAEASAVRAFANKIEPIVPVTQRRH